MPNGCRESIPGLKTTMPFGGAILLFSLVLLASGCTTHIYPPPLTDDTAVVVFMDMGITTALALPNEEGGYDRWSIGDWNYYGRGRVGLFNAIKALIVPSPAAIGRYRYPPPPTPGQLFDQMERQSQAAWLIHVPADQAQALQARMTGLFEKADHEPVHRPERDLQLVKYPGTYTYRRNSNRRAAILLTRMGVRYRGHALHASWRVMPPGTQPPPSLIKPLGLRHLQR